MNSNKNTTTQEEKICLLLSKIGWNHWFDGWNKLDDNTPPLTLTQDLPNPFKDLNLCKELEDKLIVGIAPFGQYWNHVYYARLKTLCEDPYRANAEQRAEAIGRTLSLW